MTRTMIEREIRIRIGPDARSVAALALAEDGPRDVTSEAILATGQFGTGSIEFRSGGVLAGTPYADAVATACGLEPIIWYLQPGDPVMQGTVAGMLQGDLGVILRAERPMLNLLQRAVGIATATREYVDAVAGTGAKILHTRKTAPGLRLLDVSAVLAGGGHGHRLDLAGTLMVKDNHWQALQGSGRTLAEALRVARAEGVQSCQVEVESVEQLELAVAAGANRLLVDNQTPETVRRWGALAREKSPGIEIEATGGISLDSVRSYAEAGADFISIGALTHSVRAADVALEIRQER